MKYKNQKHSAIEKSLMILSAFEPNNQEMGTFEIAEKLGLNTATVSRTLQVLEAWEFIQKNSETKKYRLGRKILKLGLAVSGSIKNNMVQIVKPFIDNLRDEVQDSVVFEVLSGKHTVMAYIAEGPRRVRLAGTIGDILPAHATAGAKSILAFCSQRVVDNLIEGNLPAITKNTITDPDVLRKQFSEIRKQGVSFDLEEHDLDTTAIAAPIFSVDTRPVGAVVIAGPSSRIPRSPDSDIALKLKNTARLISEALYYTPIEDEF